MAPAHPGIAKDRHVDDAEQRLAAWVSAMSVPKVGRPVTKARVPSSRSSTNEFRISPFGAVFLADDAMGREGLGDDGAQGRFAFAVGLRHRAFIALEMISSRVR